MRFWENCFNSFCLSFSISKMEILLNPVVLNCSVHQSHPEGLLESGGLVLRPVSDSVGLGSGLRIYISSKFPGVADAWFGPWLRTVKSEQNLNPGFLIPEPLFLIFSSILLPSCHYVLNLLLIIGKYMFWKVNANYGWMFFYYYFRITKWISFLMESLIGELHWKIFKFL